MTTPGAPLRIGMFGLRGLRPDLEITGFETAFAEIAPGLVQRGHAVTIYARRGAHSLSRRVPREDGVELLYMPSPGGKNFSALISTLLAVLHALVLRRYDVWFFVNVGMGHHCALARLSGRPVVMNVDGLDWLRAKWGTIGRAYFRSAARAATRWCTALVTDAEAMRAYYLEHFARDSTMIAYGAEIEGSSEPERLHALGVAPRDYYLIVSRLIPENTLLPMLEGFRASHTKRTLLVVGSANYRDAFHAELQRIAADDPRIRLAGLVSDQQLLRELWCNCYAYLHGHSSGGTNPALLRAMGHGCCVLARDTVFNREVLADSGAFFAPEPAPIAAAIDALDGDAEGVAEYRRRAPARIQAQYTWPAIIGAYDALFRRLAAR